MSERTVFGILACLVLLLLFSFVSVYSQNIILEEEKISAETECYGLHNEIVEIREAYYNLKDDYISKSADYDFLNLSNPGYLPNEYDAVAYELKFYVDLIEERLAYGKARTNFVTPNDIDVITAKNDVIEEDGELSLVDIEKISTWVSDTIEYNHDTFNAYVESCWFYPSETLKRGYGDCEDYATLKLSMCKAEENVDWLWGVQIEGNCSGKMVCHILMFAEVDDNMIIYGSTSDWCSGPRPERDAFDIYGKYMRWTDLRIRSIFNDRAYHSFVDNDDFFSRRVI